MRRCVPLSWMAVAILLLGWSEAQAVCAGVGSVISSPPVVPSQVGSLVEVDGCLWVQSGHLASALEYALDGDQVEVLVQPAFAATLEPGLHCATGVVRPLEAGALPLVALGVVLVVCEDGDQASFAGSGGARVLSGEILAADLGPDGVWQAP